MSDTEVVLGDLLAEGEELDGLVAGLAEEAWAAPTPAAGWTIAHQIAHLAWTDERAAQAATDPAGFAAEVRKAAASPDTFVDEAAEAGAAQPPAELLRRWREGRERLRRVLAGQPAGARVPWYGPSMSVASMATARLMETWAHGQDVADALGVRRAPTARLRHVARIGVRARGFAYAVRGLEPPAEEFRVELRAPDGELWTYGPEDAPQRVTGPALDFCLLVTQRAHRADVAVRAEGADADRWLDIAQAFAGPPGQGRPPGGGGPAGAPARPHGAARPGRGSGVAPEGGSPGAGADGGRDIDPGGWRAATQAATEVGTEAATEAGAEAVPEAGVRFGAGGAAPAPGAAPSPGARPSPGGDGAAHGGASWGTGRAPEGLVARGAWGGA